jgi:hypothetical protein
MGFKRPEEYIHNYLLRMQILKSYPFRNANNLCKFIYEMYYEESCPLDKYTFETKAGRKISNPYLNVVTNRPLDYTSENKKLLKEMFVIFGKRDFFVVKHEIMDMNLKEKKGESSKNVPLLELDELILNSTSFKNSSKSQKFKRFIPSQLVIEESAGIFTKWMTSILQFITEFEIEDVSYKLF